MELDLEGKHADRAYPILAWLVTPRPIARVTTLGPEWGTLQFGSNRLIIGVVKRVHGRDELFDPDSLRIRSEKLNDIGRMAVPHGYCRTRGTV